MAAKEKGKGPEELEPSGNHTALSDFPLLRQYLVSSGWQIMSLDLVATSDFWVCRVWRRGIEFSTRGDGIFDEDKAFRCADENEAIAYVRSLENG